MKVSDIYKHAEKFKQLLKNKEEFEYSEGWTFDSVDYPPFRGKPGVYVYARGKESADDMNFKNSPLHVLYIGMSKNDLNSRVWKHMGNVKSYESDELLDPKFKFHRWSDVDYVSEEIKNDLAHGNITVYCIKSESLTCHNLPRALEASLLTTHYALDGSLPILNLDF